MGSARPIPSGSAVTDRADDPRKAVTIRDVARAAGVSKSSVSRFLGGELNALSPDLQAQIQAAIEGLDYQPNQIARGLKYGQTRLIGMVVADVLNPYSVAVLHGADAACQQHGYALMLCNAGGDELKERKLLGALESYRIEGLILHAIGRSLTPFTARLPKRVPVVLVDRQLPGTAFDFVGLDNRAAMRLAVEHLIGQGFRHLAFFAQAVTGASSREERAAGFRDLLAEYADVSKIVVEIDLSAADGATEAVRSFIANAGTCPRAAIGGNGVVTLALVRAFKHLGQFMPVDIGLVGFDEMDWSELVSPGITTVAQPTYDIGFAAVRTLLDRVQGDRSGPRQIVLPGRLIERGSSRLEGNVSGAGL